MSYTFEGFAQQGWQCPICRRVYSPFTPMCWYCGNGKVSTSTTTTNDATIDWLNRYSITKAEEELKGTGEKE